jgi:ABC-type polysaccharide/polyol phosphate export permease
MYLGYAWWFLDPIFFMVIYMFVYQYVFGRTMDDYIVFVLIGLVSWRWMSGSITQCTAAIFQRLGVIESIAAPKHIFPLVNLRVESMLFLAAFTIVPIAMIIEGVSFTWHIIEFIPITIVTFIFLLGIGLITAHIGSFVADFKQVLSYTLRLVFYLSPVFYDLAILSPELKKYFWLNPVTSILQSYRNAFMYGTYANYWGLLYVLAIGLICIPIGLHLLRKYDKVYAKIK